MSGIKVFAPASIGNIGVGFDIMGAAINNPGDEIVVKKGVAPGLTIDKIFGDHGRLSKEVEKNTSGKSALALIKYLGKEEEPISFEIYKKMPFSSGLGSSAASAVAGAFAINEYFKRPLSKPELLPFAMEGEKLASGAFHADNVGPSLLGGVLLFEYNSLYSQRLYSPEGLTLVVIHPQIEILTSEARAILKSEISLKSHVEQSANLGLFITGLMKGDFECIGRGLKDIIIEPQRSKLIPFFEDVKKAAIVSGALGCSISGAGPSMFAIAQNTFTAEKICNSMVDMFSKNKIHTTSYISPINNEGAILL